jgi:hypothetical protein
VTESATNYNVYTYTPTPRAPTTFYKVLNEAGTPYHGGRGRWNLPTADKPGEWMPRIENPVLCKRGYHVVTISQLPRWLGPAIFEVECDGAHVDAEAKSVWERARLVRKIDTWNERTQRLFACLCAEHVLPMFEARYPNDGRPRAAIETSRRYADGLATSKELRAAAAARAAYASSASSFAAFSAFATADAAYAAATAAYAASSTARAAAYAAASSSASDAYASERCWQADRLQELFDGVPPRPCKDW